MARKKNPGFGKVVFGALVATGVGLGVAKVVKDRKKKPKKKTGKKLPSGAGKPVQVTVARADTLEKFRAARDWLFEREDELYERDGAAPVLEVIYCDDNQGIDALVALEKALQAEGVPVNAYAVPVSVVVENWADTDDPEGAAWLATEFAGICSTTALMVFGQRRSGDMIDRLDGEDQIAGNMLRATDTAAQATWIAEWVSGRAAQAGTGGTSVLLSDPWRDQTVTPMRLAVAQGGSLEVPVDFVINDLNSHDESVADGDIGYHEAIPGYPAFVEVWGASPGMAIFSLFGTEGEEKHLIVDVEPIEMASSGITKKCPPGQIWTCRPAQYGDSTLPGGIHCECMARLADINTIEKKS